MKRRFTSWLTIVAMFAGAVLPAQAMGHGMRGPPGSDFCVAGKATKVPAQPVPASVEDCAKCCSCSGGATPGPSLADPAIAAAALVASLAKDVSDPRIERVLVRARGPPPFA